MEDFDDILQELRNREAIYKVFSRIFISEADEELIGALRRVAAENSGSAHCKALAECLAGPEEKLLIELAADYARVFLGAGILGAEAAYPFESVYTSPQGLVMQDAWEDVCRLYRQKGLKSADDADMHEDHIALELAFMRLLTKEAAERIEGGELKEALESLRFAEKFLKNHLLNWAKGFARDVDKYGGTPFYKICAAMLLEFLNSEPEALSAETADLEARLQAA